MIYENPWSLLLLAALASWLPFDLLQKMNTKTGKLPWKSIFLCPNQCLSQSLYMSPHLYPCSYTYVHPNYYVFTCGTNRGCPSSQVAGPGIQRYSTHHLKFPSSESLTLAVIPYLSEMWHGFVHPWCQQCMWGFRGKCLCIMGLLRLKDYGRAIPWLVGIFRTICTVAWFENLAVAGPSLNHFETQHIGHIGCLFSSLEWLLLTLAGS